MLRSGKRRTLRILAAGWLATLSSLTPAQFRQEPGTSLGKVSRQGKLIVLELDQDALGKQNLFNLSKHTVRFTPDGSRYRVEMVPVQWDGEFGAAMSGSEASLKGFTFPFSGKTWDKFSVGLTGSLTFGEPLASPSGRPAEPNRTGGLAIDRFAELAQAAPALINTVPAISVFFKPRLSGTRYLKELPDRAVVTWSLTEPVGGVQDMVWTPTTNRFQAVLHKNGVIELSYDEVHAEDAIVGVYPLVNAGKQSELATIPAKADPALAPHLDVQKIRLSAVDGLFLRVTLEMRGPVLPEGNAAIEGLTYRVCLQHEAAPACTATSGTVWTILGGGRFGGRGRGPARYVALGTGVQPTVTVSGNTIAMQGVLPAELVSKQQIFVSATVQTPGPGNAPGPGSGAQAAGRGGAPVVADRVGASPVKVTGLGSPEVHLASLKRTDGPFAVAFESFHYLKPPRANDLTCSVIRALGDHFDMLAYYSDFRIDNPEAGTSSTGPLGGGPAGGAVTGIGANQRNLASFCTAGRFQWQFIQPVWVGANQMQEYPPDGLKIPDTHDIIAYTSQLAERTANGKIPPYDYAMSQIGHEMGHRWSAFVSAKVNGETVQLGPTHWQRGLQAPVAFPYQRPTEASAMGGGVWQDNFDGTFTQLDDDYYVPATGWSYLDLYLMGMIGPEEVPDFFLLKNLSPTGKDSNGRSVVKADRVKITVQDVIAAEGPRLPAVKEAQKDFNTGMVLVVEHGKTPSPDLVHKVNGISERWVDYWATTTGHRSTMTTDPQ